MSDLLLIPLEDSVVFPNMSVTLAIETGDEERVLLVPVHDGEYAGVGTVAEVTDSLRLPGGARAVTFRGCIAESRERLRPEPMDACASRSTRSPMRTRRAFGRPSWSAISRQVEEILDLRDADARIRDFVRAITEPGRARRHRRPTRPTSRFEREGRAARGDRRRRAARARAALAARAARRAPGAAAHPRGRRVGRPEAAARDILRRQMDSIRKELGEDDGSASRNTAEDRRSRACPTPSASRPSARSHGSSAWATSPASRR